MKPKLGDYFYLISGTITERKKINQISHKHDTFEWGRIYKTHFGWSSVSLLKRNPNKKSKVKWVLNYY